MIESDAQLTQAVEQMDRMYAALAELRSRVQSQSQEWFEVMAAGPIEEIRRLREEVDEYLGVSTSPLAEGPTN